MHKAVMQKLAENGGKVPDSMKSLDADCRNDGQATYEPALVCNRDLRPGRSQGQGDRGPQAQIGSLALQFNFETIRFRLLIFEPSHCRIRRKSFFCGCFKIAQPSFSKGLFGNRQHVADNGLERCFRHSDGFAVHYVVHETQFRHHGWRKHERIQVGVAHRTIEAVHREGQRQPAVNDICHLGGPIGIEIDRG